MPDVKWKYKGKASALWYIAGLFGGIGYFVGLVYVLITNDKNRIWALFFLLGVVGSVVIYWVFRKTDKKLTDMALKLLIGNVITIVTVIALVASMPLWLL